MSGVEGFITPRLSWPRAATPTDLQPTWAGEFISFDDWVNFAKPRLTGTRDPLMGAEIPSICIDALGRRCTMGGHFMRARDEGAFPVRFFWDCAPPERRSPWLPIADLPGGRALDDRLMLAATPDGRRMLFTPTLLRYAISAETPKHLQFPATHFLWLNELPPLPVVEVAS